MPVTPPRADPGERRLATSHEWTSMVLAFVAAFVDVICYLALFRTFTAFMTGNIIVLGAELSGDRSDVLSKLLVLPGFVVTAAGWTALIKWMRRGGALIFHRLVVIEAVLLAFFMLAGAMLSPLPSGNAWQTMVVLLFAMLAMSLQNVVMVLILHVHLPTTVMTGNLTKFVIHLLDAAGSGDASSNPPPAGRSHRDEVVRHAAVVSAFFVGAGMGALAFAWIGFYGVVLPVALLAALHWRLTTA